MLKKYAEMIVVAWFAVAIGKQVPIVKNYL